MTLCSLEEKETRSGREEDGCRIFFAGRCGTLRISHNAASGWNTKKDGGFPLSQNEFVPVSQLEQTELRGLLGGLGWKCDWTGPPHSAAA